MRILANGRLTGKFDTDCPSTREILNRVGDKWSVLVMVVLGDGPQRFNALKRTIGGISQRMLTATLRALERDGLVKRTVYPTNPPQVDYELTTLGKTLFEPMAALATWAQKHRAAIARAREAYEYEYEYEAKSKVPK